jgi:uncharacterized membrane protein YkvA (DUF1232 family)
MNCSNIPKDTRSYVKHYSDSKFWGKVKILGKNVIRPALLLYYVMKSPDVPLNIKIAILGALGYLILPSDLIPDIIPFAGYTDDVSALWAVIKMCDTYVTAEIKAKVETKLNDILGGF